MKETSRKVAILCVVAASLLWSTGGLLIKMVDWNPIAIAGIRSGISSLVMLAFWYVLTKRLPRLPDKTALFAAVNYVILVMLFVTANKLTTSANAILLQFTAPAWALLIGGVYFKEKFAKRDYITVFVVFIGMILFFLGDLGGGKTLGNIIAIISGISMAIMIILLKRVKNHKPLEVVFWGNLLTFFIAIPFYGTITLTQSNVMGILLLGVFQLGLSYIFFTKGIQNVSVLEGILIPVLEPLLNPIWVLIGTGEMPSQYALIGGAIVMAAVIYHSLSEVKLN
jgi:drug/metabolite transporter (DMT)-like permease